MHKNLKQPKRKQFLPVLVFYNKECFPFWDTDDREFAQYDDC